MSDVIYREGWPLPAEDFVAKAYGVPEEDQGPFQTLMTLKRDENLNYSVPAVLPTSTDDIYRPIEYIRSFFAAYSPYSIAMSPLRPVDAMIECSWNTDNVALEKQPKTETGFYMLDLDKVRFRDDAYNRINNVYALVVNRYGYSSRNYPYDSYGVIQLPIERDGDFVICDVTEATKFKGVRVIFGFDVADNTLPLNLYEINYWKRDYVRELANKDATLKPEITFVK